MLLESVLTLAIPNSLTKQYNDSDLDNLLKSYEIMEVAKSDFIKGELTFDEYLQLCESHQVNIDSYMETIEHNLVAIGAI